MTLTCWNLWRGLNGFRFDLKPTGFLSERFVGKKVEVGQSGQRLYVDCCVTFMSERGQTAEALVLVEFKDDELAVAVYLMPLSK